MNTKTFDKLTLKEKVLVICEFADFLMTIDYYGDRVYLCALNGHFVELYQNIETRQIYLVDIASYQTLDKYLPQIVIANFMR